MKKPLMLIPPAQAEALYDAALHETRPRQSLASAFPSPPRSWDVLEWEDDETSSINDQFHSGLDSFKAQE
jgi:hypothetical protein